MFSRFAWTSIGGIAAVNFLVLTLGGCPTDGAMLPSDIVGDVAVGETLFAESCAQCHSARGVASARSRITYDMGDISAAMNGITLTDQDIADLREFLAAQ